MTRPLIDPARQVIFMTGWAPHPSQTRPKARGSASASFHDIARELGGGAEERGLPAAAGGGSGEQQQAGGGSCGSGGCSSSAGGGSGHKAGGGCA